MNRTLRITLHGQRTRNAKARKRKYFPPSMARDYIYNFIGRRGWVISEWTDKLWYRHDGAKLVVMSRGGWVRVKSKSGAVLFNGPLPALPDWPFNPYER